MKPVGGPRRAPPRPKKDAPVEAGMKFWSFEVKRFESSLRRLKIGQDVFQVASLGVQEAPRKPPGGPRRPQEAPRPVASWPRLASPPDLRGQPPQSGSGSFRFHLYTRAALRSGPLCDCTGAARRCAGASGCTWPALRSGRRIG